MRAGRLRNARRPISAESLARSATETRIINLPVPCGAALFPRALPHSSEG